MRKHALQCATPGNTHPRLHGILPKSSAQPAGAGGRRAYISLTWLGVDPSVPRLGGVGTIEQYHG